MPPQVAQAIRWLCAATALGMLAPATAAAEPAAGINGSLNLVRFDTTAPGDVRMRLITGLQTAGEKAVGLDTRPATGELFLLTTPEGVVSGPAVITRVYRLDPETAAATFVGGLPGGVPPLAGDWATGADFNPVVDRLRVVNANPPGENYRINPNTGALAGDDPNLSFTGPATGPMTALAYDRNVAPGPPGTVAPPGTLTTLYGIDVGSDRLVVQGGIDGASPGGPNGGAVTSVGALGVAVDNSSDAGFDISPSGAAYASLRTATVPNLYTVNLQGGAVTLIGRLPAELRSLTILPPPPPAAPAPAPPAGPPPPDLTDPAITVRGVPVRLSLRRFLARGVTARIAPSEAVRLQVALLGSARAVRIARVGDVVLAERNLRLSAATRRVNLKPSRRLVARAKRFTVRLRVVAIDAAGNRRTVVKRIRVRPAARPG